MDVLVYGSGIFVYVLFFFARFRPFTDTQWISLGYSMRQYPILSNGAMWHRSDPPLHPGSPHSTWKPSVTFHVVTKLIIHQNQTFPRPRLDQSQQLNSPEIPMSIVIYLRSHGARMIDSVRIQVAHGVFCATRVKYGGLPPFHSIIRMVANAIAINISILKCEI